jgi:hypothetical protein
MGLYQLPWKYPPKSIAMELGYHVVYGVGVAGGHRLLDPLTRGVTAALRRVAAAPCPAGPAGHGVTVRDRWRPCGLERCAASSGSWIVR